MARKLKTYQTSVGFFDLAIAAPSMKAALEAWGAKSNLFQQGFASEATDPRIVAATMKAPGVVLKRPVGSNEAFQKDADVPTDLPAAGRRGKAVNSPKTATKPKSRAIDDSAARKAALAFEKEQRQRESARRKAEAAEARQRERRNRAVAKAEAALEAAKHDHDARVSAIDEERAELDRRREHEDDRWEKLKQRLVTAVRRAKN